MIAKGKAKVISEKEIITSDLIIINEKKKLVILPKEFRYKDEENNFYYGTSGEFSTDFIVSTLTFVCSPNSCWIIDCIANCTV